MDNLRVGHDFRFHRAFRPYEELSQRRRQKIGMNVSKCSDNSFLRTMATYPLFERDGSDGHNEMVALLADAPPGKEGMAAFEAAQEVEERRMAETGARVEAKRALEAQPLQYVPHHKGDLILDGSLARLYYNRPTNHDAPAECGAIPRFSIVFKSEIRNRVALTEEGVGNYIRRLLFNAAMQARRNELWAPYYLRLRDRGLSSTAAFVALSRKLAKVCFALLQNDSQFDPLAHRPACMST